MREVKATEAKARLAELLRDVEHGESIAITRHGKPVAHLVSAEVRDRANRKKVVEEFYRRRANLQKVNLSVEEFLNARHEGHRF